MQQSLPNEIYDIITGNTDSEQIFALFLSLVRFLFSS